MEELTFTPNVPQQIALKFPDGKMVEGRFGDQVMFSLTNNQVLYLDTDVAAKINALELRKNEPFGICKRWTGKKGDPIVWDIFRLDPGSIKGAMGISTTAMEAQIASEHQHQVVPPTPTAPTVGRVVFANGSGAVLRHPPRQRQLCNRRLTTTAMLANRRTETEPLRRVPGPTTQPAFPPRWSRWATTSPCGVFCAWQSRNWRRPTSSGAMRPARAW